MFVERLEHCTVQKFTVVVVRDSQLCQKVEEICLMDNFSGYRPLSFHLYEISLQMSAVGAGLHCHSSEKSNTHNSFYLLSCFIRFAWKWHCFHSCACVISRLALLIHTLIRQYSNTAFLGSTTKWQESLNLNSPSQNRYGGTTATNGRKRIFITGKATLPAPEEPTGARPHGCPKRWVAHGAALSQAGSASGRLLSTGAQAQLSCCRTLSPRLFVTLSPGESPWFHRS